MSDLLLRLETVPHDGGHSHVHLYRVDSGYEDEDAHCVYTGTKISSILVTNDLVDSLSWCSFTLRSVLALLLGKRIDDIKRLNSRYNDHA